MHAPLADALLAVAERGRCHNFHALPAAADAVEPRPGGYPVGPYHLDLSLSGRALDSFFRPTGPLRTAQQLAAEAFGADTTFFLTCGTSAANRIALDACAASDESPVLLDATSHQSTVFALRQTSAAVHHTPTFYRRGARYTDWAEAIRIVAERSSRGRPFGLVILNASSYDGDRLRLERVLPLLARASPETAVFVDEAWSAVHGFAPRLDGHSALPVVRRMRRAGEPTPTILVAQSAHKTMRSLRQGAYLHIAGADESISRVRDALVRNHTTSPSWPILASLDTARAHAVERGAEAVDAALGLRERFLARASADAELADLIGSNDAAADDEFHVRDPMKLALDAGSPDSADRLRHHLYDRHNVYLPRAGPRGLIAHFHIGVSEQDVDALAHALLDWTRRPNARPEPTGPDSPVGGTDPAVGSVLVDYVLPYPPGVPIAGPGEVWTQAHADLLARERTSGSEVFRIKPG